MPSVVTQLTRELGFPPPPSASLGRKSGLLYTFPHPTQLHPNLSHIYKALLNHRLPILPHVLTDDPGEADTPIIPTLQMRKTEEFPRDYGTFLRPRSSPGSLVHLPRLLQKRERWQ